MDGASSSQTPTAKAMREGEKPWLAHEKLLGQVLAGKAEFVPKRQSASPSPSASDVEKENEVKIDPAKEAAMREAVRKTFQDASKERPREQALPPYASLVDGGKRIRLSGPKMTDPLIIRCYYALSKHFSLSSSTMSSYVASQLPETTKLMTVGWLVSLDVPTPILYALLQGPFSNPRDDSEKESSEWPSTINTAFLYRYYRAASTLISEQFREVGPEPYKDLFRNALATSETVGKEIAKQLNDTLCRALHRIFADRKPRFRISRDEQRNERTTKGWVAKHREALEDLAHQVRVSMLVRMQLLESFIMQLIGLPGDETACRQLALPIGFVNGAVSKADQTRRSQLLLDQANCIRQQCKAYSTFPPGSFHEQEAAFLNKLLDDEAFEACTSEECASNSEDGTSSLAYYWLRLCTFGRLLEAQPEVRNLASTV